MQAFRTFKTITEKSRQCVAVLSLLGLMFSAGCGESHEPVRYPVQGTVTLDGKPLKHGVIIFKEVASGVLDSAPIQEGVYSTMVEPGARRVEISAYDPDDKPKTVQGRPQIFSPRNLVSKKYNEDSSLITEVKQGENKEVDFQVTSK